MARSREPPPGALVVGTYKELDQFVGFALGQLLSYPIVHSKTLRAVFMGKVHYPLNTPKRREFSSFSCANEKISLRVRLVKD